MTWGIIQILSSASEKADTAAFWATTFLGWLTIGILGFSGVALPATYWYIANRPNIIVRPSFDSTLVTFRVRNDGRSTARGLHIRCPTLIVDKQSTAESLDVSLPEFHARQEIEYFVGAGHEVVESDPYVVTTSHRLWLFGWLRVRTKRSFTVDLRGYRHALVSLEPPNKLIDEVQRLNRSVQDVLQLGIRRIDRRRYRVDRLKQRIGKFTSFLASIPKRVRHDP